MKYIEIKACTPKCKSTRHCLELIGLITKTNDTQIILSGLLQCYSPQKIHDEYGRYLLHMAASCGRAEVVEWLLKYKKADLHLKTLENGWTPAHCAAFYGNIDCLIILIKFGANLFKNDYDRLTAIDHLIFDKYLFNKYQPSLEGIYILNRDVTLSLFSKQRTTFTLFYFCFPKNTSNDL